MTLGVICPLPFSSFRYEAPGHRRSALNPTTGEGDGLIVSLRMPTAPPFNPRGLRSHFEPEKLRDKGCLTSHRASLVLSPNLSFRSRPARNVSRGDRDTHDLLVVVIRDHAHLVTINSFRRISTAITHTTVNHRHNTILSDSAVNGRPPPIIEIDIDILANCPIQQSAGHRRYRRYRRWRQRPSGNGCQEGGGSDPLECIRNRRR